MLSKSFYNQKTLLVAKNILGCILARKIENQISKYIITEVEAYNGPHDLASHASRGMTERNKIMFGAPGLIYIYLVYGMHYMLNIVTEEEGYPAAILIRAIEPLDENIDKNLFNGPAKLTRQLGINKNFNNLAIYKKETGLWVEKRPEPIQNTQIKKAKRVGIDYAGEYRDKLWRFIYSK